MAVIGWKRHHSSRFRRLLGRDWLGQRKSAGKTHCLPTKQEKNNHLTGKQCDVAQEKDGSAKVYPVYPLPHGPVWASRASPCEGLAGLGTWDLELEIKPCAAGNLGCTWICWGLILGFLGDSHKACLTLSRLHFLVVFAVLPVNVFRYLLTKRRALQSCDT